MSVLTENPHWLYFLKKPEKLSSAFAHTIYHYFTSLHIEDTHSMLPIFTSLRIITSSRLHLITPQCFVLVNIVYHNLPPLLWSWDYCGALFSPNKCQHPVFLVSLVLSCLFSLFRSSCRLSSCCRDNGNNNYLEHLIS